MDSMDPYPLPCVGVATQDFTQPTVKTSSINTCYSMFVCIIIQDCPDLSLVLFVSGITSHH